MRYGIVRPQLDSYVGAAFYDRPSEDHVDAVLSCDLLREDCSTADLGEAIVVPCGNWENVCPRSKVFQNSRLVVETPRVGFFRVESAISDRLISKIQTLAEAGNSSKNTRHTTVSISSVLRGYIHWRFPIAEAVREHGIWGNESGLNTVTYNKKTGKKLGVHLDSWDGTTIDERQKSLTRFCVNLGPGFRDFLWVPYRLSFIASVVHDRRECDVRGVKLSTEDLLKFVRKCEDVSIFRMRLQPFDGYIADTDNLYHDASSLDSTSTCYHYTLRGSPEGGDGDQGLGEVIEL